MIEVQNLTKRYGRTIAVDNLSFTVRPGAITGFLGPNGAGKSTTMRAILGLDRPTSGTVLVNGRPPGSHPAPLAEIGGLLDARAAHPGFSARNHLMALATTNGIVERRVDEVLDLVGLTQVARKRVGTFSLGMGQRLGIAAALLGDPAIVMLDEPVNGLDPEGILWIRDLLRQLAAKGRTVFVSSHLMAEMAETANHVIVIGRGKLIADVPIAELTEMVTSRHPIRVRSPEAIRLRGLLAAPEVAIVPLDDQTFHIEGTCAEHIGDLAAANGIAIHELTRPDTSLEEAFVALTRDAVEYRAPAQAEGVEP